MFLPLVTAMPLTPGTRLGPYAITAQIGVFKRGILIGRSSATLLATVCNISRVR